MKQEQLLDDTRESEVVDKTVLLLLVISTIVFLYLTKIAVLTVHSTAIYDDSTYSHLLSTLGFAAGSFLYNFFGRSKWVVITGFLMIMIFCVWETLVLAAGNYFDNWVQVYLLELGAGLVSFALIFIFLSRSRPFGKKQTYYIFCVYLSPPVEMLLHLDGGYFIMPETTGLFPIVICFLLMALSLYIFMKRNVLHFHDEPFAKSMHPNPFILVFGVVLVTCILVCAYAFTCNIPEGMDIAQFYYYSDWINLGGSLCLSLFASVILLRWGLFPFEKMVKIGILLYGTFIFVYGVLHFYHEQLHTSHFVFQILLELIFAQR